MKTAILALLIAPALALCPTSLKAADTGKRLNNNLAGDIKKKKTKDKRAIRSRAAGASIARVVSAIRVKVDAGKVRITAKSRATRRVNARGSMIFDLQ
ncbi:MAG: hypothetical protein WA908_06935 [Pontixanthobacter sp.]